MEYLTHRKFIETVAELRLKYPGLGHWKESRWNYHALALSIIQMQRPKSILEMGTMGVKLWSGSDEMDYPIADFWPVESPAVLHNGKKIPWPIASKKYDMFIALRVFHHLAPFQKECFSEAKRISKSIILVVPRNYSHSPTSPTLSYEDLLRYNEGKVPSVAVDTPEENFYYWRESDL